MTTPILEVLETLIKRGEVSQNIMSGLNPKLGRGLPAIIHRLRGRGWTIYTETPKYSYTEDNTYTLASGWNKGMLEREYDIALKTIKARSTRELKELHKTVEEMAQCHQAD